jgi:hypothetical protein
MSMMQWCIDKHKETNHQYDQFLPYEFHLRMVDTVGREYQFLLDNEFDYFDGSTKSPFTELITLRTACLRAIPGHDLIEDCRVSYNDCKSVLGQAAADIIYAVTNEKGKTRKDRANDTYYAGIVATPGAVFVKLCDRIANVQYGILTKSRMTEMYKKENENFITKLGYTPDHELAPMFEALIKLFEN